MQKMDFVTASLAMINNLFNGNWLSIFLALVIVAASVSVLGMIGWGVFYAIDTCFRPEQEARGVIDGHDFTPATTATIVGDESAFIQHVPKSWSIGVTVNGRHGWMDCDKKCYNRYCEGDAVIATFTIGRLSGRMRVLAVAPTE